MMKLAIDLDNTITADRNSKEFFRIITHLLHPDPIHHIVILTNRSPGSEQEIAEELDSLEIQYNQIVITGKKAEYIKENHIEIFFENTEEYILDIPESTTVFKVREEHNFSFAEKLWIGSRKTTKLIDE